MRISELHLYGTNPSKDPALFLATSSVFAVYIGQDDFLSLTGMNKKRLELYLLRHPEIHRAVHKEKKLLWLPEMLFYLAKLQRSGYGKKGGNMRAGEKMSTKRKTKETKTEEEQSMGTQSEGMQEK